MFGVEARIKIRVRAGPRVGARGVFGVRGRVRVRAGPRVRVGYVACGSPNQPASGRHATSTSP